MQSHRVSRSPKTACARGALGGTATEQRRDSGMSGPETGTGSADVVAGATVGEAGFPA